MAISHRRSFLYGCFAAAAQCSSSSVSRFKLGAISDGFSQDLGEALGIMKSYGLRWVEIRQVFGIYNTEASPAQVKRMKELLDHYEFRVSVIDSALYKCTLPGAAPASAAKNAYPYAAQMELLKRACDRAHALGADKIRGFTFWRVPDPALISGRIAEELTKAAEQAERLGMRLVIENEESCNAATARELSRVLALAPASNLGINWDIGNGYSQGEPSFPNGYAKLDKKRIWHLHLKGMKCAPMLANCAETFAGQGDVDVSGQLRQLLRDHYSETMSLECEFEAPGLNHAQTARQSLQNLIKIMTDVN